jgi:hypothetical protein
MSESTFFSYKQNHNAIIFDTVFKYNGFCAENTVKIAPSKNPGDPGVSDWFLKKDTIGILSYRHFLSMLLFWFHLRQGHTTLTIRPAQGLRADNIPAPKEQPAPGESSVASGS